MVPVSSNTEGRALSNIRVQLKTGKARSYQTTHAHDLAPGEINAPRAVEAERTAERGRLAERFERVEENSTEAVGLLLSPLVSPLVIPLLIGQFIGHLIGHLNT